MPRLARAAMIAAALVVFTAVAAPPVAATWRPHIRQAAEYAKHRHGVIAFSVKTAEGQWGRRHRRTFPSASVLKAMLLVAYLSERKVRSRPLTSEERRLLGPMIRRSDNDAASAILVRTGTHRLNRLAARAGMRRFRPVVPVWGLSRIDAKDQARFFYRIDSLLPKRHRAYAMNLLETITSSQRWGIGQVQPMGWRLFFKGGWGSGSGLVDHQVALLTRGDERVSLAILTYADGSHAYGKETLRGIARRLLRGL